MARVAFQEKRKEILREDADLNKILLSYRQKCLASVMGQVGLDEIDVYKTIFVAYALTNAQSYKNVDLKPLKMALEKIKNITPTENGIQESLKDFENIFSVVTKATEQHVSDYNGDKMSLYKVSKACILLNDLDRNMFGWLSATFKPKKIQNAFDETKEAVAKVFSKTSVRVTSGFII